VVSIFITKFNVKKFYVPFTECVLKFCMAVRQTAIILLHNIDAVCTEMQDEVFSLNLAFQYVRLS